MDSSFPEVRTREKLRAQEPEVVRIDPECLHLALKEFFEPLRTNDPRTDFFAVYRKESADFDRDYARKYDEDLNTSLIFAGLFSAVSSAFIIDVQSKLEPDPNDMTAAYMQILIHALNNTLFPDADPSSVAWTGPPLQIVAVQSLLYASLTTSLFAAFLAMLGKQWVNRYLRNRGGSTADKSRDRQRKLDGLEKWRFHLAIESLPVMLQFALLLLGCALSLYLWTISRTVAGVVIAVTLFGLTSYAFLTLAATFYYNCPYQTPPSIIIRTVIKYLTRSNAAFARSLRSFIPSFLSIRSIKRILVRLRSGFRHALESFRCIPTVVGGAEHIPLATIMAPPARIFDENIIDWEVCKADARCISWVLYSTTETDVIFSTVRFAADMVWYPEIARALSPYVLADLFFDCLLDGQIIPGMSEHASSIGMALASVLSVHLCIEPEDEGLHALCGRIHTYAEWDASFEPTFRLVIATLRFAAHSPQPLDDSLLISVDLFKSIPSRLPTVHQLWLSRVTLQTVWRWSRSQDPSIAHNPLATESIRKTFAAGSGQILTILKTNFFLTTAISLGLQVDIRDLYVPNNNGALGTAIKLFNRQLQASIKEGKAEKRDLTTILSTLTHINPFQVTDTGEVGFEWIAEILNSGYSEDERYEMSSSVIQLLGSHLYSEDLDGLHYMDPAWILPTLGFLSLCEKFYTTEPRPHPGLTALRILSSSPRGADVGAAALSVLTSTLLPTHPLRARSLALKAFCRLIFGWFSPQMENVPGQDLEKLLHAVGDPFQFTPDIPLEDGQSAFTPNYEPMMAIVVLLEFASSELWRDHLQHLNFASCEGIVSTKEGKEGALKWMLTVATRSWFEFLHTPLKITAALRRLEEIRCMNTAEVVIIWAWTIGVVDPMDHDSWRLVQRDTLRLCQTNGTAFPQALKQHIADNSMETTLIEYLIGHYEGTPCRVGSVKKSSPALWVTPRLDPRHFTDLRVSQVCQLRRLYQLFGYGSTTWKEVVVVEKKEEEMDALPGHRPTPLLFVDWACDYP